MSVPKNKRTENKLQALKETLEVPELPTNNGSNTLDVETTLKPSEVYIKYKGV